MHPARDLSREKEKEREVWFGLVWFGLVWFDLGPKERKGEKKSFNNEIDYWVQGTRTSCYVCMKADKT